jgi:hypothetical protein
MKSTNACIRNYLCWYNQDPDDSGVLLLGAMVEFVILMFGIFVIKDMFISFVDDVNMLPIPIRFIKESGVYFTICYIIFDSFMIFRCVNFRKRLIEIVRHTNTDWSGDGIRFIISKKHTYIGFAIKMIYLPFAVLIILTSVNTNRNCDIIIDGIKEKYKINMQTDAPIEDKVDLVRDIARSVVAGKANVSVDDLLFDTRNNTFVLRAVKAITINEQDHERSRLRKLKSRVSDDYDRSAATIETIRILYRRLQHIRDIFVSERYTFLDMSRTVDMHIDALRSCLDANTLMTTDEVNVKIVAATSFCDAVENLLKSHGI